MMYSCLKLSDNGKALCLSSRALLYSSSCLKSNPLSLTLPNRPPILSEGQVFLLAWCHLWSGNGKVGGQAKIKPLKLQILSTVPWLYPRTPYIQRVCLDFVVPYLSKSNLLCPTTKFWPQPYSATSCLELTHLMPCNMSENDIDGDRWWCCQKKQGDWEWRMWTQVFSNPRASQKRGGDQHWVRFRCWKSQNSSGLFKTWLPQSSILSCKFFILKKIKTKLLQD